MYIYIYHILFSDNCKLGKLGVGSGYLKIPWAFYSAKKELGNLRLFSFDLYTLLTIGCRPINASDSQKQPDNFSNLFSESIFGKILICSLKVENDFLKILVSLCFGQK